MPSFLFNPALPIDFLLQYLLEWDFQGRSPPSAEFISLKQQTNYYPAYLPN